ncbi:MAG: DUF924 family protein [Stappiaceae bacterium]
MSSITSDPIDVLSFWWQAGPEKWFQSDDAFDEAIRSQFGGLYEQAFAGTLDHWAEAPHGALALVIVLDQFPRNMFRKSPKAFQSDQKALSVANRAVDRNFHLAFPAPARDFFFMPFEHAEDMEAQEKAVDLFRAYCDEQGHLYALIHMDVIRRFGRFPHRNDVLGRQSSESEIAFLAKGGFSA